MTHKADVLIVTVTDVESRAVIDAFREVVGKEPTPEPIGDRIYLDLGEVRDARVFMALSEMGSGGIGGSQKAVDKGIEALSPSAVVMVGVAFGINDEKQAIGDILVSRQLWLYELQRVGPSQIIPRGDKPHASPWLINWLQVAQLKWNELKATVRFGLVLSGEKLMDNIDYREQLKQFEPEAIGGEMEGAGLYVASQDKKIDWILVKGICDWADGEKGKDKQQRQQLAARNAAAFVVQALQQVSLKRDDGLHLTERWSRTRVPAESCRLVPSSLPAQAYFFGREKELNIIADAISPEARTWGALIDGPGGIGKTALALRAAHIAPDSNFDRKIFLSAKVRELTPEGEQQLEDFMLPNYMALLTELARELGDTNIERTDPKERPNALRRSLAGVRTLIVIDNIETFQESERLRLYQFLSRLPTICKAIVTSRRRADIDARVLRLDRLERGDALDLIHELAKNNRFLQKASENELVELYELTNGNPLLIKWTVGQLGRRDSHCRTLPEAFGFLKSAPKNNDPLGYVFGDLADTFTNSETAVLAALAHFTEPAEIDWVTEIADIGKQATQTALEDLADRAVLQSDPMGQTFLLPSLAAAFLRGKYPDVITTTGSRLTDRAYALMLQNGGDSERFPELETHWSVIAAALPLFLQGDNGRLQRVCGALGNFLNYSGRWDEWIALSQKAEEKAIAIQDYWGAGERAFDAGFAYSLRGWPNEVLIYAEKSERHWKMRSTSAWERGYIQRLRGIGYYLQKDYPAALEATQRALDIFNALSSDSSSVSMAVNMLAEIKRAQGNFTDAERDYREALRIAKRINYKEGVAYYNFNLAELALDREDWKSAETAAREMIDWAEKVGQQEMEGKCCRILAKALARQSKQQEGLAFARRSVGIFRQLRIASELEQAQAQLEECGG